MTDLTDLIARVEKLEGPDREVDAHLWWALRRPEAERCYWNGAMGMPKPMAPDAPMPSSGLGYAGMKAMAPAYTKSLDAALALVEMVLGEKGTFWRWRLEDPVSDIPGAIGYGNVYVVIWPYPKWEACIGEAKTPALALILALLRAQESSHAPTP